MQALILAAGMGRRLGHLTDNNTKCMVSVNGRPLIDRMLDILAERNLSRACIVVGYEAERLIEHVGTQWNGLPIEYVRNDVFDRTNNIYSLYLARDELAREDTLLLESDLIFEADIIDGLLSNPWPNLAVVDQHKAWMDGTVVQIAEDDSISRFVPKRHFRSDEVGSYFKTVNIYKLSADYLASSYIPFLRAYCEAMGNNDYYEQVLRIITHLETNDLRAHRLTGQKWYEIDDVADLSIAETLFADGPEQYGGYLRRHGGYWRFPDLMDYCYLVNPYFPTGAMVEEMTRSFDTLLREYPSALWVQNLLAAKTFGVRPEQILVGNGAAELITGLGKVFTGKRVAMFVPSFEEYAERFGESHLERVDALEHPDERSLAGILRLASTNDAVILVNPDNPTGAYLSRGDLRNAADELQARGVNLIVDESFVDFGREGQSGSLLDEEFLSEHPSLIVIKSISKSYGVPGSRLGVLACGDPAVIAQVRGSLSVWNVNSFGEFFLQIIGKYEADYWRGCELLREERQRFISALNGLDGVDCLPSEANFIMCRLSGRSAGDVANELLRAGALVKDLTGKQGIPGDRFLRLAIRTAEENDRLVAMLADAGLG